MRRPASAVFPFRAFVLRREAIRLLAASREHAFGQFMRHPTSEARVEDEVTRNGFPTVRADFDAMRADFSFECADYRASQADSDFAHGALDIALSGFRNRHVGVGTSHDALEHCAC